MRNDLEKKQKIKMWKSKNEKIKMKVYTKMKNKNEKSDVHVLEQIFNLKLPKQSTDSLISTKSLLRTEKISEI